MTTHQRAVAVSRHGQTFALTFSYHPELVDAARLLPYATFDRETKLWTSPVCLQSVERLRTWDHKGWLVSSVDTLLTDEDTLTAVMDAVLRPGSSRRPYTVTVAGGNDTVFSRLRAIGGSAWDKKAKCLTFPPTAASALVDLVAAGLLSDPETLLASHAATIAFDPRVGRCTIVGNRDAATVFGNHFPHSDVAASWKDKGLDVGFLDDFTTSMYNGELVRAHGAGSPEGLNVTLYPFQRVNARIASLRPGHAIFDEPGLGKTMSGIAAGMWKLQEGTAERIIVICPAAVRTQWAHEITRATGHEDITVVTGSATVRKKAIDNALADSHRWIVCHYDILSRDKNILSDIFTNAYVIADEAHRIKSSQAARTKALRSLSAASAGRLALTGTPVETNPSEWFDILSGWVTPGILGSPGDFNERYRWKNQWGGYEGARNIGELASRSRYLYTRHTKADVAQHLPPLQVQQQELDPEPSYAAALRRAHADAAHEIRNAATETLAKRQSRTDGQGALLDEGQAEKVSDGADMTAVGLLRLLCSSPKLVLESDSAAAQAMRDAGLVPDIDGPKVDYLRTVAAGLKTTYERRMASQPAGSVPTPADVMSERMVIFTFSERMARLLGDRLTEDGVGHVLFTGSVTSGARDTAIATFTDPASDVQIFISTDAGAEGLNLGKCCSLLVNADLAWTASKMAQRAQRIHRVDSTATHYHVINLTLTATLEAGIVRMLESRADLTDTLLGEHGSRSRTTGKRRRRGEENLLADALSALDDNDPLLRVPAVRKKSRSSVDVVAVEPNTQMDLLADSA